MCSCITSTYHIPCLYMELPGDEQDCHGETAQTKSQVIIYRWYYHSVNKPLLCSLGDCRELGRVQSWAGSLPSHCSITQSMSSTKCFVFLCCCRAEGDFGPPWMSWRNILLILSKIHHRARMKLWWRDKWDLSACWSWTAKSPFMPNEVEIGVKQNLVVKEKTVLLRYVNTNIKEI